MHGRADRQPDVLAAVGQDGEHAGGDLHHHFPGREHHDRHQPGQVRGAGPIPAAGELDDPDDAQRDRGDQHGLPGQDAVAECRRRQQGMPLAVGQHPRDQAQRAERLGEVAGQAVHQAEVADQQQAPDRVPAGLPGQQAAQVAERAERGDVDRGQRVGHRRALAERRQPGQRGVTDPHEPVRRVHGDAERRLVQVRRIQRQPVVELAVVAGRVREDEYPVRHPRRVAVYGADPQQLGDRVVVEQDQPAFDRGERGHEGDQPGNARPVRRGPQPASPARPAGAARLCRWVGGCSLRCRSRARQGPRGLTRRRVAGSLGRACRIGPILPGCVTSGG